MSRCKPFHPTAANRSVFIPHGLKQERREVQVGEFNDEFIEVKSGHKRRGAGTLASPDGLEPQKPGKDQKEKPGKK